MLFESNAILSYFAEGTELAGRDAWERAQILQWMFFEQYSHEPNVATLRFWHFAKLLGKKTPEEIAGKRKAGEAALAILDAQLAGHPFLVGERFTIADVALFAYTHVAGEGGFDLRNARRVTEVLDGLEGEALDEMRGLVQTSGALVMYSMNANAGDKLVYFMSIDKARFRHPVVPGDLLRIPVKLMRARAPVWKFAGEAYVDGKLCAEAEYSAMIIDKAGKPTNTDD